MRLVLLTDLHFGRAQPDLVPPLLASIAEADPDLILIAGDFVQRARADQFRQARTFLSQLRHDWIAVPGNHDIPLFNLTARFLAPRAAYRRYITRQSEPLVETDQVVIVGLDTVHRFSRQRGQIDQRQIDRVADLIRTRGQDKTVVVMAHHPFHHAPEVEKKVMLGASLALETWSDCGPHVIVSGHLHTWTVEPFLAQKNRMTTLQVHCGTGLSTRLRGQPNEFAILDLDGADFSACRMTVPDGTMSFVPLSRHRFTRSDDGWQARD